MGPHSLRALVVGSLVVVAFALFPAGAPVAQERKPPAPPAAQKPPLATASGADLWREPIVLEILEPATQPLRREPGGAYTIRVRVRYAGGSTLQAVGQLSESATDHLPFNDPGLDFERGAPAAGEAGTRIYTLNGRAPRQPGTYWLHVLVGEGQGCCNAQAFVEAPVQLVVAARAAAGGGDKAGVAPGGADGKKGEGAKKGDGAKTATGPRIAQAKDDAPKPGAKKDEPAKPGAKPPAGGQGGGAPQGGGPAGAGGGQQAGAQPGGAECPRVCTSLGCRCTTGTDEVGQAVVVELVEPEQQPIRREPGGAYRIRVRVRYAGASALIVDGQTSDRADFHPRFLDPTTGTEGEGQPTNERGVTVYTINKRAPRQPGTYWVHVLVGETQGCCREQAFAGLNVQLVVAAPVATGDKAGVVPGGGADDKKADDKKADDKKADDKKADDKKATTGPRTVQQKDSPPPKPGAKDGTKQEGGKQDAGGPQGTGPGGTPPGGGPGTGTGTRQAGAGTQADCVRVCTNAGCQCPGGADAHGNAIVIELIEPEQQPIRRAPLGPYRIRIRVRYTGPSHLLVSGPLSDRADFHPRFGEPGSDFQQDPPPQPPQPAPAAGTRTYTLDARAPRQPGTYWVHVLIGETLGCCQEQALAGRNVQLVVVAPPPGEGDKRVRVPSDTGEKKDAGPSPGALRRFIKDADSQQGKGGTGTGGYIPSEGDKPPVPQLVIPSPREERRPQQPCHPGVAPAPAAAAPPAPQAPAMREVVPTPSGTTAPLTGTGPSAPPAAAPSGGAATVSPPGTIRLPAGAVPLDRRQPITIAPQRQEEQREAPPAVVVPR
jgi:D-serine deaminase-like pyridoxal phosphate-dependent protein